MGIARALRNSRPMVRPWPCPGSRRLSTPHTYSHCVPPGLQTDPMLYWPSQRPLCCSTSRESSSDRSSPRLATACRTIGPLPISLTSPKMTTLGWLRSRSTISRRLASKRSAIFGESASSHEARFSS